MRRDEIATLLRWWVQFADCEYGECNACDYRDVCCESNGLHEPGRARASIERYKAACLEAAALIEAEGKTPPTTEEVRAYCAERGNRIDPDRFCDYYNANGWHAGKQKMRDWRAAVRNWERMDGHGGNQRDARADRRGGQTGDYI